MIQADTFADLVHRVADRLTAAKVYFGHGTDNAWDEAAWLVFYGLGIKDSSAIEAHWPHAPSAEQCATVNEILRQRIEQRKPLAYILGYAWFAGLEFKVNEHVLIPRSPLAELIARQYRPWLREKNDYQILDLCCGSGCIGLATAIYLDNAKVDLVDISPEALAVAKENQRRLGLEWRSQCYQSDLLTALPAQQQYDLIVANPPYVDAQDLAGIPPEYQHEPLLALEAGADGLRLVRELLARAADYLKDDGVLITEVGNSAEHLIAQYPQVPFIWLEFCNGGDGVFLLEAATLRAHRAEFIAAI